MIEVVSLLGTSYTGKSTLANGIAETLNGIGIKVDIVKKDDAFRALGTERYGDNDDSGGYSIRGFLKHGAIPSSDLHAEMNKEILRSRELGRVVILEGGTRTRTAQAQTLRGVDTNLDNFRIFMLELPIIQVIQRARQRRSESGRYDDMLPVAVAKLYGQYRGIRSADAPKLDDPDVIAFDARLKPEVLVKKAVSEILNPTHK